MSSTMSLARGRPFDLRAPDVEALDIRRDIAEPLARIARFGGHMDEAAGDCRIWSVGQHCVVGAKALLAETFDPVAALGFLVHDAHEAVLGDLTNPFVAALAAELVAGERSSALDTALRRALARLKRRFDLAFLARAFGWPAGTGLPRRQADLVAEMDRRMLAAEARQILGADLAHQMWGDLDRARPVNTHGALKPWPIKRVADEWMALWTMLTARD